MNFHEAKQFLDERTLFLAEPINKVVEGLDLNKNAKILDVGTGNGKMAIILALNGYNLITGEPKDDDTEYAKQNWQENAKNIGIKEKIIFKYFNIANLPFDDEEFDAVFIFGSFHHFENKHKAIEESMRVIKKDGLLCIIEPNAQMIEKIKKKRKGKHPDGSDPRKFMGDLSVNLKFLEEEGIDCYFITKK